MQQRKEKKSERHTSGKELQKTPTGRNGLRRKHRGDAVKYLKMLGVAGCCRHRYFLVAHDGVDR